MKNATFTVLIIFFCCASIQFVCALETPENRIYSTQFNESKHANERALIFLNNNKGKRFCKKSAGNLFITKKSNILINSYFNMSGTNKLLFSASEKLPTEKKPEKFKLETNRFEDKNGDGINDIVTNSKL
ncbi:hypothetical protein KAH27_00620 [bacterium]|nr:hypothetical protein [bacterium]